MKRIIFAVTMALSLSAGIAGAFEDNGIDAIRAEKQTAAKKAYQDTIAVKAAEQAAIKAKADAEKQVKVNAAIQKAGGVGWYQTGVDLKSEYHYITTQRGVDMATHTGCVADTAEDIIGHKRSTGRLTSDNVSVKSQCRAKLEAFHGLYPGSQMNSYGAGRVVSGSEQWIISGEKVQQYQNSSDENGLSRSLILKDKFLYYDLSKGQYSVSIRFSLHGINKSRIVSASLSMNAQSSLTQIFNARGVTIGQTQIMALLEAWYRNDVEKKGFSLQSTMSDIIVNPEAWQAFLDYCAHTESSELVPVPDSDAAADPAAAPVAKRSYGVK